MSELDEIMKQFPDDVHFSYVNQENSEKKDENDSPVPKEIVVILSFTEKDFGAGEITIMQDEQNRVFIDTETMGKENVLHFLEKLVEGAITDTDTDPEKHALYCKMHGQVCAENCKICHP